MTNEIFYTYFIVLDGWFNSFRVDSYMESQITNSSDSLLNKRSKENYICMCCLKIHSIIKNSPKQKYILDVFFKKIKLTVKLMEVNRIKEK